MNLVYSKYNTIIIYKEYYLLFNTLRKELLLLDNFLKELIESVQHYDNSDELHKIHSEFYEILKDKKFLVSRRENELEIAESYINSMNSDISHYKLIINPTMNCNFKCWYCYETHIKDSKMDNNIIEKVSKLISNILDINELRSFELSFFGGEPFLYYKKVILPLLHVTNKICNEKNVDLSVSFTTNGYLITTEIVDQIRKYSSKVSYQITLDGDENEHDKVRFVSKNKGSYREIVNNIKIVAENNNIVTLRINYTKSNFSSIINILGDFEKMSQNIKDNITISLHKVWQEEFKIKDKEYEEIRKRIKILGFKIPSSLMVDAVKYSCYADKKNQATINYNGDVYKCTARDFNKDNIEGTIDDLGNIIWNSRNDYRNETRLLNKPCKECFLLPMCAGGCSQHALEHGLRNKEYCVHDFNEENKKQFVLEYLENVLQ